jgi:hypothetical protein
VIWFVVRRQAPIRSAAIDDGAVTSTKQHPAVSDIGHSETEFVAAAAWNMDYTHRPCRTTLLLGIEKVLVSCKYEPFEGRIILRASVCAELLMNVLCHGSRARFASVPVKDAKKCPIGARVHKVRILHIIPPTVRLC